MIVRRVLSVILFVIGGWILASGMMVAWLDMGRGLTMELGVTAMMCVFSLPFLLLGMWASPGHRLSDLGLTVMIGAAVGAGLALMMMLFLNDPTFVRLMPPNRKMPDMKFAPVTGAIVVLVVGGVGWLLFSRGKAIQASSPE